MDLAAADCCVYGPYFVPESAAYHCQQAAEKLVKAIIVAHKMPVPRIHDIETLVAILPADLPFLARLEALSRFTPYGFAFRYPGEAFDDGFPLPDKGELTSWIEEIRGVIAAAFEKHAGP